MHVRVLVMGVLVWEVLGVVILLGGDVVACAFLLSLGTEASLAFELFSCLFGLLEAGCAVTVVVGHVDDGRKLPLLNLFPRRNGDLLGPLEPIGGVMMPGSC